MNAPSPAETQITRVIRRDWGRILAALVRTLGDFALAEDSLQDAVLAALDTWPVQGVPKNPDAWLITVARRKALDRLRRDASFARKAADIAYLRQIEADAAPEDAMVEIPDKRLELIFTCCHPAIEEKSRIALTLRALGGLTTPEIAAAFLDKPEAMAARLTRAKRKITDAGIPFRVPETPDLPERVAGVLRVIYLIFNEGYRSAASDALIRADLIAEAIRLGEIMVALMPDERESRGLLALMLLHDSRRAARLATDGSLIALDEQDRELWDSEQIERGRAHLLHALGPDVGPYGLQAAISALHAEAPSFDQTDWAQIHALYIELMAREPNPVIGINQAVALSYVAGPQAALDQLNALADGARFARYQPFFAARADLYARLDQPARAIDDYKTALALTHNSAELGFLSRRLLAIENVSR